MTAGSKALPPLIALLLTTAVAVWIRANSGLGDDAWFSFDAALHYRMTHRAAEGRLDEIAVFHRAVLKQEIKKLAGN